jgi:demethoxyubiquinone hydroxylase (CLK1/Coq7/Cat5 family)
MPLFQSKRLREDHFREYRGQEEDLQKILAKKQLKKGVRGSLLLPCRRDKQERKEEWERLY